MWGKSIMLNGKNKRCLRSLANGIKPIVMVGKEGLSENLFKSIEDAFNTHELIKVSILKTCEEEIDTIAENIVSNNKCELIQKIGKTLVFYKKAKEPKIIF